MKSNSRFGLEWIAIIVSLAAAAFTGLQWWEAREQRRIANDAQIALEVDTDPSENKLGIGVRNVGPGTAHILSVKFYIGRKQISSVDDAVEEAKLDPNRLHEIDITDDVMGPGELIWILRYNARKAEQDRAADFFEKHLNAAIEYCSAGGRCATECTDKGECGASK